jgi:hypothetical protein
VGEMPKGGTTGITTDMESNQVWQKEARTDTKCGLWANSEVSVGKPGRWKAKAGCVILSSEKSLEWKWKFRTIS